MAWFTAPSGATCVAAYDAIGAASLADSYTDESGTGNTAAPGVAPTWTSGAGWTFNGSTQYLTTGLTPADTWSMIVRFSGGSDVLSGLCGAFRTSGGSGGFLISNRFTTNVRHYRSGLSGNVLSVAPRADSGVMAVAAKAAYLNGVSDGTITAGASTGHGVILIGAYSNNGVAASITSCSIQALAIYSGTLSGADVATITSAMNALAAARGLPVLAHWHHQVYGGGH